MDINAADIAALEKILHQAEEWMLEQHEGGATSPASDDQPAEEDASSAEEGAEEPAIEIDLEKGPPKRRVLDTYEFVGGAVKPHKPPPQAQEDKKVPVGKRGRY